jgi:hypothetical protein
MPGSTPIKVGSSATLQPDHLAVRFIEVQLVEEVSTTGRTVGQRSFIGCDLRHNRHRSSGGILQPAFLVRLGKVSWNEMTGVTI